MRRRNKNTVPETHDDDVLLAEIESTDGSDSAPESKVPSIGSFIGTVVVIAILVAAIAIAFTLNRAARQLPLIVAVPTLAMAVYILIRDIVRYRVAKRTEGLMAQKLAPEKIDGGETEARSKGMSERQTFVVFGVFVLLYLALGFPWGASIFLLLYLLAIGKVGIIRSVMTTVCVVVPFYVVFIMIFRIPNFSGLLLS